MKSFDCYSCLAHSGLEMVHMCTSDPEFQRELVRDVFRMLSTVDFSPSPVEISESIKSHIRERTGTFDPYVDVKKRRNRHAATVLAVTRMRVEREEDRLRASLKAATAGNILDATAGNEELLEVKLEEVFSCGFARDSYGAFLEKLESSRRILYIADNAGEIFFDKLVVEELVRLGKEVEFCVRGYPAVDDALEEDYLEAGLNELTSLVTTGTSYQGVVLGESSAQFLASFEAADLILTKGMGNFETIGAIRDPRLFLAFIAKCHPVARVCGVQFGDFCFVRGGEILDTV